MIGATKTDGRGNPYLEIPTLKDEAIRLTLVPAEVAGYGVKTVRLNIRQSNGRLRHPGPEIPVQCLRAVVTALDELTDQTDTEMHAASE